MKTNHLIKGLCVAAIALTFNACKKDSSSANQAGNTQVSFALSATNSNNALVFASGVTNNATTGQANITWTSGIANVAYFKLEAKKKNTEIEITTKNLSNIDLFAITPASISTVIDTGTYREIELRVFLAKSSTAVIPLTLKGTFITTGGAVVPIEFDFNDDALIKVEAENVTIDGKTDIGVLAKLNLTRLISGAAAATLDAATRTNGTIVISNTSNTAIYNKIKDNVLLCGDWGGFSHHDKSERHG